MLWKRDWWCFFLSWKGQPTALVTGHLAAATFAPKCDQATGSVPWRWQWGLEAGILVGLHRALLLPCLLPSASGPVWKYLSPSDADFNWDNKKNKKGWEMLRWAWSRGEKGKADHGLSQHGVWLLSYGIGVVNFRDVFSICFGWTAVVTDGAINWGCSKHNYCTWYSSRNPPRCLSDPRKLNERFYDYYSQLFHYTRKKIPNPKPNFLHLRWLVL